MKLSDIMSHAGLAIYAEIALLIFLAVWVVVALRTFAPGRRRAHEEARMLPFDDELPARRSESAAPSPSPSPTLESTAPRRGEE